jgi:hypothetical protein
LIFLSISFTLVRTDELVEITDRELEESLLKSLPDQRSLLTSYEEIPLQEKGHFLTFSRLISTTKGPPRRDFSRFPPPKDSKTRWYLSLVLLLSFFGTNPVMGSQKNALGDGAFRVRAAWNYDTKET